MIVVNKIYNECNLTTCSKIENGSVDYVLTSPPYNVSSKSLSKYNDFTDDFTDDEYFEQQKTLINELLRITKNHIFYNIQMVSGNKLALHKLIGHFANKIKEVIIWKKVGQPAISENVFNSAFEYIIIFSNNEPNKRYFNDANFTRGTQSNVFQIKNSHSNPYAEVHKAIMPLDIPRYFMQNFGKENDLWYDPYNGAGTTSVAAIMEKRNYIGSEISPEYYEIGNTRINNTASEPTLF